jgi:alpha-tubulin suppressor-like RCC1 family protein
MSQRYPGGLLSRSAPVVVGPTDGEGGSASGVWTLEQAGGYIKQGLWPKPIIPKALYAWGPNNFGQLGQNNTINRSSPVQVGADTTWKNISGAYYVSMATKNDGTLWIWGYNTVGQLGLGNTVNVSSPVQVGALTNWSNLTGGSEFSVATKTDGTLWSWGKNNNGQLGQNLTHYTNISSPTQAGSLTNWSVVKSGNESTYSIKTDGTLWSWGANSQGQLGQNINTSIKRSSPVQIGALTTWLKAAAGRYQAFAIKTDGTLWAWGDNRQGQLGLNSQQAYGAQNRSSPAQVGALTTWLDVASGNYHAVATRTDGTLWSWGRNGDGQLGQNNTDNRSSPVQVGAGANWYKVSCGFAFTVVSKTDGTLWAFGRNDFGGALGVNNTINYSSPVQIGSLNNWLNFSCGFDHTLALQSSS